MSKKITAAALFLSSILSSAVWADSVYLDKFLSQNTKNEGWNLEFVEKEIELPEFFNVNQGEWVDLYVEKTYTNQVSILAESIHLPGDGSIRYVLNVRSNSGVDNITAEGMLCVSGGERFSSESSKMKTFAYADTIGKRWIKARNAQWQSFNSNANSLEKIRQVIYDVFCSGGRFISEDEVRKRLRSQNKTWQQR